MAEKPDLRQHHRPRQLQEPGEVGESQGFRGQDTQSPDTRGYPSPGIPVAWDHPALGRCVQPEMPERDRARIVGGRWGVLIEERPAVN
jgi:hypothetical protein